MTEQDGDFIQGTCMQMCPQREILLREKQRRLHFFETVAFTSRSTNSNISQQEKLTADPRAVVKEFTRSAAGKAIDPSELRPFHVLLRTVNYLIDVIAAKDGDYPWHMIYLFVFDRTRSVRQDLVVQRISGKPVVEIFEKICRFHIISSYQLCESTIDVFDGKINNDHLAECLKRLLCFYDVEQPATYRETRAEFEVYYLLHNLGSVEALTRAVTLPEEIKRSCLVQLAFDINLTMLLRNYVRFFRLVKSLPYLACCAVHKHFNHVRADALATINTAYFSRNASLPLTLLVEMLNFNDVQEAKEFCSHSGLEASDTAVKFVKGQLNNAQMHRTRFSGMIDTKLSGRISGIISGKDNSCKTFQFPSQNKRSEECSNDEKLHGVSKPVSHLKTQQSWFGKGRGKGRGRGWKLFQ